MKLSKWDGTMVGYDYLCLLVVDIDGKMREVTLPSSYATEKVLAAGIGFDASNFGYAPVGASDMVALPDFSSAFIEEKDGFRILRVFCDVKTSSGDYFDQYPRAVARSALESMRRRGIGDDLKVLVELEFFVFDKVAYSTALDHSYYRVGGREGIGDEYSDSPHAGLAKAYHLSSPDDKYQVMRHRAVRSMLDAGIGVKYHHHEAAAGQQEIELDFVSIARAGDAVTLAKWILANEADEMGLKLTFMPKPMRGLAGSGMHVHQFVVKDGKSIFPGEGEYGLSDSGLSYAAGILVHASTGSLLAFSNPSTNSYRRLRPGFEAPTEATLARGSRAAAIRVPGYLGKGESRIEYRTGDATANIYYYLSAMLLAGIDGVERRLDPAGTGFIGGKSLPSSLSDALRGLGADKEYLKEVFPASLIAAWAERKRKEADYVDSSPVPQEYELYF